MSLSKSQLKFLRAKCHSLKPVVMLGKKGLTDEVMDEINIALSHHELIKIKLPVDDRAQRALIINEICDRCGAVEVQSIGKTLAVYRANPDKPVIILPKN